MKLILAIAALLLAGTANSQTETITDIDGAVRWLSDDIDETTEESLTETGQTQEEADLTESTLGTAGSPEEEAESAPPQ